MIYEKYLHRSVLPPPNEAEGTALAQKSGGGLFGKDLRRFVCFVRAARRNQAPLQDGAFQRLRLNAVLFGIAGEHQGQRAVAGDVAGGAEAVLQGKDGQHRCV